MLSPLIVAVSVATATTCIAILALQRLAPLLHLVDTPVGRKQHTSAAPQVGGIAITLGLLTLYFTMPSFFLHYWAVFASALVLMIVGVIDDIRPVHSAVRMLIQIGIGCVIHFQANLPFLSVGDIWFMGDLGLGPFSLTFTCIAVVGGVNAINMMDGLDGLCGLMVSTALAFLAGMALYAGYLDLFLLAFVLLSVVLVFLLFNYRFPWNNRARIFLGDSGAYVLGFLITVLFLMASQGHYTGQIQVLTPVTALWLLFIPLIDIAGVIWRRSRRSRWPVSDDREHLHYILVDSGVPVSRAVNGLFMASLLLAGLGVTLFYLGVNESWSYVVFMACCVAYFLVTNRMTRQAAD